MSHDLVRVLDVSRMLPGLPGDDVTKSHLGHSCCAEAGGEALPSKTTRHLSHGTCTSHPNHPNFPKCNFRHYVWVTPGALQTCLANLTTPYKTIGHQNILFWSSWFSLTSEDSVEITAVSQHLRSVWVALVGRYGIDVKKHFNQHGAF